MNLYYCPCCPMTCPAWLTEWQRYKHMLATHSIMCQPMVGSGLPEWHGRRAKETA